MSHPSGERSQPTCTPTWVLLSVLTSVIAMYNQYVKGKTLMYLPLYKVSQDHLERLFGYIRSRGGHNNNPSCKQFTSSFKRILLHKELEESNTGNALVLSKSLIFKINKRKCETEEINSLTRGWRSLEEDKQALFNSDDSTEDEPIAPILESTSTIACNIVEYIAGYVVRCLRKKIVCKTCCDLLVVSNVTQANTLIHCKNRGGLLQPSEGVVKICLMCEAIVKLFVNSSRITSVSNVLQIMTVRVMEKCVGINIFPGNHYLEQEPDQNYFILLMKAVCKKYFTVRLHHHSKTVTESFNKIKVRNHLTKTITFLGQ